MTKSLFTSFKRKQNKQEVNTMNDVWIQVKDLRKQSIKLAADKLKDFDTSEEYKVIRDLIMSFACWETSHPDSDLEYVEHFQLSGDKKIKVILSRPLSQIFAGVTINDGEIDFVTGFENIYDFYEFAYILYQI